MLNYVLDSDGKITTIRDVECGFDYKDLKYEDVSSALRKVTYYVDNERTQVICSVIYSNEYGKSIEILNANGVSVYKAEAGSPLPKIN